MFDVCAFNKCWQGVARFLGVAVLICVVTYITQMYGLNRTTYEPASRGSAIHSDTHLLNYRSRADTWSVSRIIIPLEETPPTSAADGQLTIVPIKAAETELDWAYAAGGGRVYAIGPIAGGPYYNLLSGAKDGDELLLQTSHAPSKRLQVIKSVKLDCQQVGTKRNVLARQITHCPQQNVFWIIVRDLDDVLLV